MPLPRVDCAVLMIHMHWIADAGPHHAAPMCGLCSTRDWQGACARAGAGIFQRLHIAHLQS